MSANGIIAQSQFDFRLTSENVTLPLSRLESEKISFYKGCLTDTDLTGVNPVSGELSIWNDSLRFEPIVPFSNNQDYSILVNDTIICFQIAPPDEDFPISIVQIFPSSNSIPANFLKWYIQFSKPVNPANIYNYISILDDNGQVVNRAFIKFDYALLNDQLDLLTLWVEPGRQKRDLGPNLELGPVFKPGGKYELVINKNLKDNNGIRMGSDWRHQFYVTNDERNRIDLQSWYLTKPGYNTDEDLIIRLEKPVDYGSFMEALTIVNKVGIAIEGKWTLEDYEQTIVFKPELKWEKGVYTIHVRDALEDLAGNRINRLFDQPLNRIQKNQGQFSNSLQFHL